jgi:hypothetical protein
MPSAEPRPMGRVIVCSDGTEIYGSTDDELVARLEAHVREAHPEIAGRLSREEILVLSRVEPSPRQTKSST